MQLFKPKIIPSTKSSPSNISVEKHPANKASLKKFEFYEAFWIFLTGSVVGFIFEIIWCVIRSGRLENRTSMIFGPFSVIYGIAAVVLHLISRYADKSNLLHIFAFGTAALTLMEYFCSFFQESLFGSVSWDYSGRSFNIGGRVCLMYSFIWGLLAILWVVLIQPKFESFISKIPARMYKPLTWGLAIFLILDVAVSAAAVSRWGMRLGGVYPSGIITEIIDKLFPNEFMVKVYPNMYW